MLLVEDDPDTLEVVQEVLAIEGSILTVASGAQQALELAKAGTFDLVISDLAMPDMDGFQMIAELRRRPHSAAWPSIAISGFGRADDAARAKAAGFDRHLSKPLSIDALHETYARRLEAAAS